MQDAKKNFEWVEPLRKDPPACPFIASPYEAANPYSGLQPGRVH